MKYNLILKHIEDLIQIKKYPLVEEVLIEPIELSRFGNKNLQECQILAQHAKNNQLKTVLVWDQFIHQKNLNNSLQWIHLINWKFWDEIRVLDLGILNYLYQHTQKPIQLIAEYNHHNLEALLKFEDHFKDRLSRLILSLEISKNYLQTIIQKTKSSIEIQGVGRILMFQSPRKMLNFSLNHVSENAMIESKLSGNRSFPVFENSNGFFMFHHKDIYILDKISELESIHLDWLRLDNHFNKTNEILSLLDTNQSHAEKKSRWPRPVFKGFYKLNQTQKSFFKFHNPYLTDRDQTMIGEVIQTQKDQSIIIELIRPISRHIPLLIVTPEGHTIEHTSNEMRDIFSNPIQSANADTLIRLPWRKRVAHHALVYQNIKK